MDLIFKPRAQKKLQECGFKNASIRRKLIKTFCNLISIKIKFTWKLNTLSGVLCLAGYAPQN